MKRLIKNSLWVALVLLAGALLWILFNQNLSMSRPDFRRLYQNNSAMMMPDVQSAPVILIPGLFGSKLRNKSTGEEVWPGAWWRILFSSYPELALNIDPVSHMPLPSDLEPHGITEQALQQDIYQPILQVLTEYGGYTRTSPGTRALPGERRLYVFDYDWRQDIVTNARALARLVRDIQRDYQHPTLQVDLVAHSMGGLIARYYLRFGDRDVLDGEPQKVSMQGAANVRKLIQLGTPNLGSIDSLVALIRGEKIGFGRISSETLATFPSGYQLLPHPLTDWLINIEGKVLPDDLFESKTWQRFGWSIYAKPEKVHTQLKQADFQYQLTRARRLAWMLSVKEPESPLRYVLFGGGCQLTAARLLLENYQGREYVRLKAKEIAAPKTGVPYDDLMSQPGDSRVTKPSLLARETLDPSAMQNEDSFLPIAYTFFLCENHTTLTKNINFQDNLLNVLLSRQMVQATK